MRYRYPQAFPYAELVAKNLRLGCGEPMRLLDTSVCDSDRYFDVQVGYQGRRRRYPDPRLGHQPQPTRRTWMSADHLVPQHLVLVAGLTKARDAGRKADRPSSWTTRPTR
jgi:hypothetical protein